MENTITYTDIDNSCNVYRPIIDASLCHIREPFDLSNTFFREHFEGKELLLGQTIREYFYISGSPGPEGPPGPPGPMGPCGPTGPIGTSVPSLSGAGGCCDTFLNIYSTQQQQVASNSPVVFHLNNYVKGSCAHEPDTTAICVWKPGFYHVYTNIYHIESCQFSLCKNNDIIPASTIGSIAGACQNSSVSIVQITDSDICMPYLASPTGNACVLQLLNNTPYIQSVSLYDSSSLGYTTPQIVASLTLFFLSN